LKFWHKMGFRVVGDSCQKSEPKVLHELLRANKFVDWRRAQKNIEKGREIQTALTALYDFFFAHKDDPKLRPFLKIKKERKGGGEYVDAVRMKFCGEAKSYTGWVAPDISPTCSRTPSPRRSPKGKKRATPSPRRSPKGKKRATPSARRSPKGKKRATPSARRSPKGKKRASEEVEVPLATKRSKQIRKGCLKGYELKNLIGEGGWGTVSKACLNKKCTYAVKLVDAATRDEVKAFDTETKIQKDLWENGQVGPKFYGSWKCDNVGLSVTDMWDGELPRESVLSANLLSKILKQIHAIHKKNIVHGDILRKNILVKLTADHKIKDITITDFGSANKISKWKKERQSITNFYRYHLQSAAARKYYRRYNIQLKDVIKDPRHLDFAMLYALSQRSKAGKQFWNNIKHRPKTD